MPVLTIPISAAAAEMEVRQDKLDAARVWLKRALLIKDKKSLKAMALKDSDLTALWEEIRKW